ncbi:hypothetical protein H103_01561 [Trichophyton rubrum CBS 288.86]|uniref:Uncharacterized protein n=1 Tax=Trichophyton rubrum CBS 288.86 TaxID=1215330 RepID=A0A022WCQ9_TRIRU|nr:hypothetical protein H102_01548 [Trichophyton rubrum CBS 100081]EZF55931.1 hypothetical protein H103_01561 [Trichophyton rubrum CBS 288.86]EZG20223.1 hypothetical protein H107_01609 [Trichophyton rubrum CBS 202.88]
MAKLLQQSSEPTSWWIRNTLRRCMAAQFEIVFEEGYGSSSTTRGFFNACSHWIVRRISKAFSWEAEVDAYSRHSCDWRDILLGGLKNQDVGTEPTCLQMSCYDDVLFSSQEE